MKYTKERDIERALDRKVRAIGGITYKWASPGVRGVPDRIVMYKGEILFVELKAPGKRPTRAQRHRFAQIAHYAKREVLCIDSIEAVDEFITGLKNGAAAGVSEDSGI